MKKMNGVTVTLTNEQMTAIKNIEAKTRYEAMDKVAKILNAKAGQRGTWSSSRKTIIIDENTHADITFSKGKVTKVQYYDNAYEKNYMPIDIKNYKPTSDAVDESIKALQKKLGAMLLPR
jgi:hypothetical protein